MNQENKPQLTDKLVHTRKSVLGDNEKILNTQQIGSTHIYDNTEKAEVSAKHNFVQREIAIEVAENVFNKMASCFRQQIRLDNLIYINRDHKNYRNCWVRDTSLESFRTNNHVVDTLHGRGGHPW